MKALGITAGIIGLMAWTAYAVVLTVLLPPVGIPALLVTAIVTPLGLWAGHRKRAPRLTV